MSDKYHDPRRIVTEEDRAEYEGMIPAIGKTLDRIYGLYNLETFAPAALLGKKSDLIYQDPTIIIPDMGELVDVTQIGDEINWSFEIPEIIQDNISVTSSKRGTTRSQKYKIRHEFIAETFCSESTDEKLSDYFTPLDDDDDILSPDFIIRDILGIIHVIELTTRRTGNRLALRRAFDEKFFKYEQALQNRAIHDKVTVTFTIIVVSPLNVLSNVRLPEEVVNEMLIRMTIVSAIENVAIGKGFSLTYTENEEILTFMAQDIKVHLEGVEEKEKIRPNGLGISTHFIQEILGDISKAEIYETFSTSIEKSNAKFREGIDHEFQVNEYIRKLKKNEMCREDCKPVVILPAAIPARTSPSSLPKKFYNGQLGEHCELIRLWNEALLKSTDKKSEWKEEDTKTLLKEAMTDNKRDLKRIIDDRHKNRNKYHVVDLQSSLSTKMTTYLGKYGVLGKASSNQFDVKQDRLRKKLPISFECYTEDIVSYLENEDIFTNCNEADSPGLDNALELIQEASDMAGNGYNQLNILKLWTKTKLFNMLEFISDIAYELAVSVKTNLRRGKFIIKKIRDFNAYVLIKTTNTKSHVFFSLYFPKDENTIFYDSWPFKKLIQLSWGYVTTFSSVRVDKLENLCTAPSTLLSFVAYWSNFYNMDSWSPEDFLTNPEARKMLMMTILLKLEDKAESEETITLTRYMYMELFKGRTTVRGPDPFKILSKMTEFPRSRLNVFLIKKVLESFSLMMNNPPRRLPSEKNQKLIEGEDSTPEDEWTGLVNFFTLSPIMSASKVINLCYLGYVKNKNETAQGNSSYQLVEKVLDEEMTLNMREKEKSLGTHNPDSVPGPKQFKKENIIRGCQLMEKKLKSILGRDWKMVIEKEILEKLSYQLTDQIATLKASSSLKHEKQHKSCNKENNKEIHRIKVIEALACNLTMAGVNPFLNLEKIIKFVENSEAGIIADLFQKNQHGGLREIYVLTIESRVLQLFIETISRTLCSYFPEETLTHPSNKLHMLDKHKMRAAKIARHRNCLSLDLCSSSDKKRWNQNFTMPAMSIPLFRLTTPIFHNAIQRILNLWADKLIKIPPQVCDLLISRTHLSSKAYEDLLIKFWKPRHPYETRNYILGLCHPFINVTTGMMQGILHYTSSLLHLSFLHVGTHCVLGTLRKLFPNNRFIMTQVCSSDDSATILSVFTPVETNIMTVELYKPFVFAEKLLHSLAVFCQFFCMRESEKSTIAMPDYVEFNSEFILKNTVAKPLIKLTAASMNLTESESFTDRFHTCYNLISDMSASGMDFIRSSFTQMAQALMHYKTMGYSMTGLFKHYTEAVKKIPLDILGFFYLDDQRCCGIMGYSYSKYLAFTSCQTLYSSLKLYSCSELEMSPEGGSTLSLSVKHGDFRKWHLLIDRVEQGTLTPARPSIEIDKNTKEVIVHKERIEKRDKMLAEHFELMFRKAQTLPETKLKLMFKANMPGVGKSLGRGNPFFQAICMSIYSIGTHCFTRTSSTVKLDKGVNKTIKTTDKLSILLAAKKLQDQMSTINDLNEEDSEKVLKFMFPLYERYKEAAEVVTKMMKNEFIRVHRIRNKKSHITVQPIISELPLSLYQVLSKLWFDTTLKTTLRMYRRCLAEYELQLPWIRPTYKETLENSPFQTLSEMYNYISSQSMKSRHLAFTGPGIYSTTFQGQLKQLIQKNYLSNHLWINPENATKVGMDKLDVLSRLSLALEIPVVRKRSEVVERLLKENSPKSLDLQSLKSQTKRSMTVSILGLFLSGKVTKQGIIDIVNNGKIGTVTSFTKPQTKSVSQGKIKWTGTGECVIMSEGIGLKVKMRDDYATEVVTRDWDKLKNNPGVLREAFESLGVRALKEATPSLYAEARFQGTRFVAPTSSGTPIVIDKKMDIMYLTPKRLEFKVFKGKCGLFTKTRDTWTPVLYITGLARDIPSTRQSGNKQDIWDCWMSFRSLDFRAAYKFLSDVSEKFPARRAIKQDEAEKAIKSWLESTLKSRLKFRGIGYLSQEYTRSVEESEDLNLSEGEEEEDDWLTDIIMDEYDGDMMESIIKKKEELTRISAPDSERVDEQHPLSSLMFDKTLFEEEIPYEEFRSVLQNFSEEVKPHSQSIYKREVFNYLYMHPLWDDFIDETRKMDPNFFNKVMHGVVSLIDPNLSTLIMDVLGIAISRKELNITDRFKMEQLSASSSGLDEDDLPVESSNSSFEVDEAKPQQE